MIGNTDRTPHFQKVQRHSSAREQRRHLPRANLAAMTYLLRMEALNGNYEPRVVIGMLTLALFGRIFF